MNVLHVTRRFHPCIGGVERYIHDIAKRLNEQGVENKVLTLNYDIFDKSLRLDDRERIDGIEINRIGGWGYYKKPIPLALPLKLFKWADIVHLHDIRFLFETSSLLKRCFRFKIVYNSHGFLLHTRDFAAFKDLMIKGYYRNAMKTSIDALICGSKQDYEYFSSWGIRGIKLIENGIDFGQFAGINKDVAGGMLLYYGRIDKNKGLDKLFRSLALMKNDAWQMHIAGGGFDTIVAALKKLAEQLGISDRITWHGFVSSEQLRGLLSKAKVCVFPSSYEGFGLTLVEAMAAGNVCIVNAIPTYKDIIAHENNGIIVDFDKTEQAAEDISKLMRLPAGTLGEMGMQARKTAQKYDWYEKVKEIRSVYESVL